MTTPDPIEMVGIEGNPDQGPFVQISLKIQSDVITEMHFRFHRCGVLTFVCCKFKELIVGKSITEALAITPEIFLTQIRHLPLGKQHYPKMVVAALGKAILGDR